MKTKLLILSTLIMVLFTGCGEVAKGTKIGQVIKVNEASGFFYKTIEVEIIRGGFSAGTGAQGGSLHFTIENNPNNLEIVKKAMTDGSEVEVEYHKEIVTMFRSDSDNVFGDKIKVLSDQKSKNNSTSVISYENNISSNLDAETKQELLKALKLQNEVIQKLLK